MAVRGGAKLIKTGEELWRAEHHVGSPSSAAQAAAGCDPQYCAPQQHTWASRSFPLLPMPTILMGEGSASVQPCSSTGKEGRCVEWWPRQRRWLAAGSLLQRRTWKSADAAATGPLLILNSRLAPLGTRSAGGRSAKPQQAGCSMICDSTKLTALPKLR